VVTSHGPGPQYSQLHTHPPPQRAPYGQQYGAPLPVSQYTSHTAELIYISLAD
jgi:hypothetical protein